MAVLRQLPILLFSHTPTVTFVKIVLLNYFRRTMLLSNLEQMPGKRIVKHLGLVQGSTVRSKHLGRDFLAGIKNVFGGELSAYTELLQESREEAVKRMTKQASAVGANAIVNVRFSTSSITQGAAELFAYGTAVTVEDE
ncbi:MAG: hypothetical protein ACI9I4_002267 [Neolewinella sp.]